MIEFVGNIVLTPASDSWTRTIVTEGSGVRNVIGRPIVSRNPPSAPIGLLPGQRPPVLGGRTRFIGNRLESSFVETIRGPVVPDTHIRSRNVAFSASNLRPLQRHYAFFENTSGIDIIPKLTEISMTSGTFVIGETIKGFVGGSHLFSARAYAPNHKTGPGGSPTTTYSLNPYDRSVELPSVYSSSSTILNVDINSLVDEVLGLSLIHI